MHDYKISIIIPCYSVGEELLNEALKSIEIQSYKNWEIILIDDYSPEEEWKSEIVERLQKENKLKLIRNKTNLGLSISRNIGFEASTGEIILFLDPDDKYRLSLFFSYLNETFKKKLHLDVIQFKTKLLLWNESKKIWIEEGKNIKKVKEKYFEKINLVDYANEIGNISVWNKAYKKSFIIENNIKHLNKITPHEDWVFSFQIFSKNPNVILTNQQFNYYRKRQNSITHKISKCKRGSPLNMIKIAKNDIFEYLNDTQENDNENHQAFLFLGNWISYVILIYGYKKCEKELEINKNLLKKILKNSKKYGNKKLKFIINLNFIGKFLFKFLFFLRNKMRKYKF